MRWKFLKIRSTLLLRLILGDKKIFCSYSWSPVEPKWSIFSQKVGLAPRFLTISEVGGTIRKFDYEALGENLKYWTFYKVCSNVSDQKRGISAYFGAQDEHYSFQIDWDISFFIKRWCWCWPRGAIYLKSC